MNQKILPAAGKSDGLIMRDAVVEDAEDIAEIYNATVAARDATMDLEPRPAEYFAAIIDCLTSRESFIVLEHAGEIVGWGRIMRYSDREGYSAACETAVYIRRALRHLGHGTLLKRELIQRCRSLGYHHLVAKVFADNRASIEYNLRQGYEIVGTQREIGLVSGTRRDVTILQLILDDRSRNG